jgi:hypothetical protein
MLPISHLVAPAKAILEMDTSVPGSKHIRHDAVRSAFPYSVAPVSYGASGSMATHAFVPL